jgi:Zn-dependent protease with chaperone function
MPLYPCWEMAAIVVAVVLLQFMWSRIVILSLHLLGMIRPPDEKLARMIADGSARLGVAVRRAWVAQGCSLNAIALPLTGELIFTSRLLRELSDSELDAVCAHELGHLGESRTTKAGRLIGAYAALPILFIRPVFEYGEPAGIIVLLVAMYGLFRLAHRLSQRMERRADGIAALHESEPGVYARALEKIHIGNQVPAVMYGKDMTHPHLYDRMVDAGVTPDYPRPHPPEQHGWHTTLLMVLLGVTIAWILNNR